MKNLIIAIIVIILIIAGVVWYVNRDDADAMNDVNTEMTDENMTEGEGSFMTDENTTEDGGVMVEGDVEVTQ